MNRMLLAAAVLTALASQRFVGGQEPEVETDAAERLTFMKASAQVYDAFEGGVRRQKLSLVPEPLLRWNNPVSDVQDGTVAAWVDAAGRPAAVAQVFLAAGSRTLWLHEFQSLSLAPFTFERDGRTVWSPAKPGVEMKPIPDAPVPAATPVRRLAQMRALAGEFSASDNFEEKSRWELRLMSKPLLRWGKPDADALDGALFVFAHGTDPEVFLLLEARQTESGYQWQYALAPMTSYALRASHKDEPVWEKPFVKNSPPNAPYFILQYRPAEE